jgi:hypothetical protein
MIAILVCCCALNRVPFARRAVSRVVARAIRMRCRVPFSHIVAYRALSARNTKSMVQ